MDTSAASLNVAQAISAGNADTAGLSRLEAYGLAGLRLCWMPALGRWSHQYHLDGRAAANESLPHSDVYYSLNVLLGLSRLRTLLADEPYDVATLFPALCYAADALPVRNGLWGMALWAGAELDIDVPGAVASRLSGVGNDIAPLARWRAQDVGLSLSGACAQARRDRRWQAVATNLRNLLMSEFRGRGALFRDASHGPRRHIASFATQVYSALSLYQYAELMDDAAALQAANACVAKLITLQGELGEWPWFYAADAERVLDRYEVYSVHQHGMAPALLHHAVAHGVPGARSAIVRGFNWIFGQNEMKSPMLVPTCPLIYRSHALQGLSSRRDVRALVAVTRLVTGKSGVAAGRGRLRITQEMRSYEFGWLLWSFGGRSDFPTLTDHPQFIVSR